MKKSRWDEVGFKLSELERRVRTGRWLGQRKLSKRGAAEHDWRGKGVIRNHAVHSPGT